MRQKSFKTSSANEARINLEMSKSLVDQVENLNIAPAGFRSQLKKVNSEYSQFVSPYRGKERIVCTGCSKTTGRCSEVSF